MKCLFVCFWTKSNYLSNVCSRSLVKHNIFSLLYGFARRQLDPAKLITRQNHFKNVQDNKPEINNKEIDKYLKCGFCKKLLLYECNSDQLLTFFSFCHHFWVGLLLLCYCTHPKVMTKMLKKCSSEQRFIRERNTIYKIHTLVVCLFWPKHFRFF